MNELIFRLTIFGIASLLTAFFCALVAFLPAGLILAVVFGVYGASAMWSVLYVMLIILCIPSIIGGFIGAATAEY